MHCILYVQITQRLHFWTRHSIVYSVLCKSLVHSSVGIQEFQERVQWKGIGGGGGIQWEGRWGVSSERVGGGIQWEGR